MIALVLSFLFSLAASWFLLTPIIEGVNPSDGNSDLDYQLENERLFSQLEELEQEKYLNRITEENYLISKEEIFSQIKELKGTR